MFLAEKVDSRTKQIYRYLESPYPEIIPVNALFSL